MRSDGPNPPLGLAVLRVVTGVVFVAHGAPKLFGGEVVQTGDFLSTLGFPLPEVFAWIVTLLEFFGGLGLIVGLLVTPLALLFVFEMLLGIILVHAENGFYVIGPGQGGIELNLLLIGALVTLVLAGPGMAAIGGGSGADAVREAGAGRGSGSGGGSGPGGGSDAA